MFRHEGPSRSARKNAVLAGYLAVTAGFVNSGGFVLVGDVTSHVTGSVGRMANDLAQGNTPAAIFALLLVVSFFVGAFAASLLVESREKRSTPQSYGWALLLEGGLLGTFIFVAGLSQTTHLRIRDAEAALLCCAMGVQNSLVTSLSGAVVRTTHLTGVVTDLGIEVARWYRWQRAKPGRPVERPPPSKLVILVIIVGAFTVGSALGAFLTLRASRWSMVLPVGAVVLASLYAFRQQREMQSADDV